MSSPIITQGASGQRTQKSIYQGIVNLMRGSLKYGDGKSIANTSIIVVVTVIILLIGIILQYSKVKSERTKEWRLAPSIVLGIGGTLLYGFVSMAAIAYRPKTMSTVQMIIHVFKILIFTYLYAVYCIFPLIVYADTNENIYDDDDDDDAVHNHQYMKTVNIITLITNILLICTMIYIIYLLLWQRDAAVLKRQLLVIAVMFGVMVGKNVKETMNKIGIKH